MSKFHQPIKEAGFPDVWTTNERDARNVVLHVRLLYQISPRSAMSLLRWRSGDSVAVMVASVVPITRIRRATTWWDYTIPRGMHPQPGQLVSIPWRGGRSILGIVWEIRETSHNTKLETILECIGSLQLLTQPTRNCIEWLAAACALSYSTTLYVLLPKALRETLTPTARRLLTAAQAPVGNPPQQHIILQPQALQVVIDRLRNATTAVFFSQDNPHSELSAWLAVRQGVTQRIIGRERAAFAAYANLHRITIQYPEDISYNLAATPNLGLVEFARQLARSWRAELCIQSYLPQAGVKLLFPDATIITPHDQSLASIEVVHHRGSTPPLEADVLTTLRKATTATVLVNRHDRTINLPDEPDIARILPGAQGISKYAQLPEHTHRIGTRAILPERIGTRSQLGVVVTPARTDHVSFGDALHTWADLMFLARTHDHVIVQTPFMDDPLTHALRNQQLESFIISELQHRLELGAPPFGTLVCVSIAHDVATPELLTAMTTTLQAAATDGWRIGSPLQTTRRGKPQWSIPCFQRESGAILPTQLFHRLAALARPWRIERNPWYIL
jgi:hypothetical protein